jgi:hypothetical protein
MPDAFETERLWCGPWRAEGERIGGSTPEVRSAIVGTGDAEVTALRYESGGVGRLRRDGSAALMIPTELPSGSATIA